ncbi:translation initiation factor IF-2-like [Catharus ustulatus]|uniref:translation initiation factor IF-2-like n=1 Tax=Catharus ustulatus TaxID=91951 RepID=UPI0014094AFF|nr:translation initiation factor IF-2-like [Catharus ustulatus]
MPRSAPPQRGSPPRQALLRRPGQPQRDQADGRRLPALRAHTARSSVSAPCNPSAQPFCTPSLKTRRFPPPPRLSEENNACHRLNPGSAARPAPSARRPPRGPALPGELRGPRHSAPASSRKGDPRPPISKGRPRWDAQRGAGGCGITCLLRSRAINLMRYRVRSLPAPPQQGDLRWALRAAEEGHGTARQGTARHGKAGWHPPSTGSPGGARRNIPRPVAVEQQLQLESHTSIRRADLLGARGGCEAGGGRAMPGQGI